MQRIYRFLYDESFSAEERVILALHYLDSFTIPNIAQLLDMTPARTFRILNKARARLASL